MVSIQPFVGRQRELQRLREALDGACEGRGGVVLISGEPGIGKTRLVRELEPYAVEQRAQVLWGRSHEAGGAPPYWPWTQALQPLIESASEEELRAQVAADGSELARIVPAAQPVAPDMAESEPIADPQAAQFRLFHAVASFLDNLASAVPLVVVLDDLHWADQSTLQLLEHAAIELAGSKLLLIGTYRDVELGRQHPLEEMLAGINRAERCQTIDLRGLSANDTAAYVREVSEAQPSAGALSAIYRETEGNAFFLQEVVAQMLQDGTLASGEVSVPQSVRAAIGRRLSGLSEECNELLRAAAVVGREFNEELLSELTPGDADVTSDLLEAALATGVVEELVRPGEYRFSHALIQETLLAELRTSLRVRLHGRIAEALETLSADRAVELGILANHFAEASTVSSAHASKAIRYSLLAGREAEQGFAWGEAVHLYERATSLADDAPQLEPDIERAELYSSLARAADNAGAYRLCWRAIMTAADEYRQRGDGAGIARLCSSQSIANWAPKPRIAALLHEASELIGSRADVELGLLGRLTATLFFDPIRPFVTDSEAEELVARLRQRIGSDEVTKVVAEDLHSVEGGLALRRGDLVEALKSFKQVVSHSTQSWQLAGDLDQARGASSSSPNDVSLGLQPRAIKAANQLGIALVRDETEEFERLLQGHDLDSHHLFAQLRAIQALEHGDLESAIQLLPGADAAGGDPSVRARIHGIRCAVFWRAGLQDEAAVEFGLALDAAEESGYRDLRAGADLGSTDVGMYSLLPYMFDEAAAHLADETERAALKTIIRSQPGVTAGRMLIFPWCAQRVYGDWALVLGMDEDAERLFLDALEWCERERCPIEAGRCHQGLAAVRERREQRAEALGHLEAAAALFERHGAKFYLDQVHARREDLAAAPTRERPSYPGGLSAREVEVLELIVAGSINREIAARLVIAESTVANHVRNILAKTETANRTEAGAWAVRHGLGRDGESPDEG